MDGYSIVCFHSVLSIFIFVCVWGFLVFFQMKRQQLRPNWNSLPSREVGDAWMGNLWLISLHNFPKTKGLVLWKGIASLLLHLVHKILHERLRESSSLDQMLAVPRKQNRYPSFTAFIFNQIAYRLIFKEKIRERKRGKDLSVSRLIPFLGLGSLLSYWRLFSVLFRMLQKRLKRSSPRRKKSPNSSPFQGKSTHWRAELVV